jgi:apolipoprotein N-acyltransferase
VERPKSWRRKLFGSAFKIGFAFGFGYFTLSLHWMAGAFLVEPDLFLWALPLGIFGLPAVLALFWGAAAAIAHLFWSDFFQRIVGLAVSIAGFEFLRGHIFTGFPWNLPGMALGFSLETLQISSLMGIYGMSFLVLLIALSPAAIWPKLDQTIAQRFGPFVISLFALGTTYIFGVWNLSRFDVEMRNDVTLRLVQPNIPQNEKWQFEYSEAIFQKLIALSTERTTPNDPGLIAATHLIWPESVFPFFVAENPDALARIARMLPNGTSLLAGAARENIDLSGVGTSPAGVYNSIVSFNDQGEINGTYNKVRLVPFGEYVPFKSVLGLLGIREMVSASDSFIHGKPSQNLMSPSATPAFLPLVCYEVIFSGGLGKAVQNAQWMLNLTNDAWFEGTIGAEQHFAHARLRAIEEGVPLVRVANKGVTAIVDPLGRITVQLSKSEASAINAKLPERLERTVFSDYRHGLFYLMIFGAFLIVLLRNRWRRYWEVTS